eukprot:2463824-Amphidinium_carterae.3
MEFAVIFCPLVHGAKEGTGAPSHKGNRGLLQGGVGKHPRLIKIPFQDFRNLNNLRVGHAGCFFLAKVLPWDVN